MAGAPVAGPGISSTFKQQVPPWHFPLREDAVCCVAHILSERLALAPVGLQCRRGGVLSLRE